MPLIVRDIANRSTPRRAVVSLALLSALAGCSFAQGPTVGQSQLGEVAPSRGRVYVYRPYNYVASAANPTLAIDNVPIGQAQLVSALYCDLEPGNHVVSSLSLGFGSAPTDVPFTVVAGQNVYVRMSPGLFGMDLSVERPDSGASEIQSMHLVPAACPSSRVANTVSPQNDEVLKKGADAERREDFSAALAIYTDALKNYVTRFEAVPDVVDRAIDAALRLRPPPKVPETASAHAAKAESAIRDAKTRTDLSVARREYANALAEAPWWSDVWFNLAKVDEQLGSSADVRRDLTWYLRAAPDAPDREQVRKQIDTLR